MSLIFRRRSRSAIRWVLCVACTFAPVIAAAQDLPSEESPVPLATGHSAAYYGISDRVQQRASARAILADAGLDRVRQIPSVWDAGSYFVLKMLFGGASADKDLAEARPDVGDLFADE